ncbi:MAG TPA: hypothetical protein VHK64_01700, partial [Nocardioidaceae bacterium]|nr:hypothetical protein [Nocardioidaceae bacterium]
SNMPTGAFPPSSQDGMIVSIGFTEQVDGHWSVDRPVVIPTWVDREHGFVIRPIVSDLRDPSIDAATKDAMYASLQRSGAVVGAFVQG